MNQSWSEAELAYFAGIIDGEGCFTLTRPSNQRFGGLRLQVGNTDPLLMQWIHQHFGGSLSLEQRRQTKHQSVWRWVAAAADLETLLPRLIPYLITKKRQAELTLAYRATLNTVSTSQRGRGVGRSTVRISDDVKRKRDAINGELSALKRPHLTAVSA